MSNLHDEKLKGLNVLATGTHTNIADAERDAYSNFLGTDRPNSLDDMRNRFFYRISTRNVPLVHHLDMKRAAMLEYAGSGDMSTNDIEKLFWEGVADTSITLVNNKVYAPLFVRTTQTQVALDANWIPTTQNFSIEFQLNPNTIVGTNIICGGEYNQTDSFYMNYTSSEIALWHNSIKTSIPCGGLINDTKALLRFDFYADRVDVLRDGIMHCSHKRSFALMSAGIAYLGNAETGATNFSGDGTFTHFKLIDRDDSTNNSYYHLRERGASVPTSTAVPHNYGADADGTLENFTGANYVEVDPLPAAPAGGGESLWVVNFKDTGNEHCLMPSAFATFGGNFEFEFFLYVKDLTQTNHLFGGTGNSSSEMAISVDGTNLIFRYNSVDKEFAHSMVEDTWYLIKFVNTNAVSLECFVDGGSLGTTTASAKIQNMDEIGGREGTTAGLDGYMVDIHLRDSALSSNNRTYLGTIDSGSEPTTTLFEDSEAGGDDATLTNFTGSKWVLVEMPAGYPIA